MKTADLTGAALDWAVAKAEGLLDSKEVVIYSYRSYDEFSSPLGFNPPVDVYYSNDYRPSTSWKHGGPLIDKYDINLWREGDAFFARLASARLHPLSGVRSYSLQEGPTKLIAAMRCLVTSQLGCEVDVPAELT